MVSSTILSLVPFIAGASGLVLKEEVGRLPALGWNSWNAFHCDITESQFLTVAQKLIDLGFKDAGYEYVNIDDCWSVKDKRDQNNRLIPDPNRFPDGINGTAKKIHDLGLKFGIYSSAGTHTCAGYPASIGYEAIDAETWAEWGVDYLKYDNCYVPQNWTDTCNYCEPSDMDPNGLKNGTCVNSNGLCPQGYDYSNSNTAKRYNVMRDALIAQNRPILYSICEWGTAGVQQWGNGSASSWRMSGDINPDWGRIVQILNENSFFMNKIDFWGHSDADMLEVGNGLSVQESRTHFSLWAAMKSPLLIGTDLERVGANDVAILKNKYLLAFNQDAVIGTPATPYKWGTNPNWTWNSSFPAEYWSGASTAGTLVLMFNPYTDTRNKTADFREIPQLGGGSYNVIDVWTGQDLGCQTNAIEVAVQGHDTAAFLVGSRCRGKSAPKVINQEAFH